MRLREGKQHSLKFKFLCIIRKLVLESIDLALPDSIWHGDCSVLKFCPPTHGSGVPRGARPNPDGHLFKFRQYTATCRLIVTTTLAHVSHAPLSSAQNLLNHHGLSR